MHARDEDTADVASVSRRLRLLVTNDDGIDAPGIRALALAAADAGHDVVIAAPARQSSGSGAAILVDDDAEQVPVEERRPPGRVATAWAVHAAPAMCVLLGLRGTFGPLPDAVLSGVNYGANTGRVLLHSGTAGAALTAGVAGVRAIAVSLDLGDRPDQLGWDDAGATAVRLLGVLMAEPAGTVLNLNVPNSPGPHRFAEAPLSSGGVVHTSTSDAQGEDESVRRALARGEVDPDAGSDLDLLAQGLATVTSITPPGSTALLGRLPG